MKTNTYFRAALLSGLALTGCNESRNKSIEQMNAGVESARQKIYDSAIRNLKAATETDPTNHLAWSNLGAVYKDQKKWDDAANAFSQAAKLQDGNASYHYELGLALQEAGIEAKHPDASKTKLDDAAMAALVAKATQKFAEAQKEYEAALKISPSYKTYFRLGTILEAEEKYKEADAQYRKAIELNPRFPEPFIRLGNLYQDHDYDAEAVKVFQEAAKVNDEKGEVHLGLGEALQKTKKYDEAVKEFKKALERNGELFIAVYDIGMSYKMMDDKKNAKEWLQRYVQNAGSKGSPELVKAASDAMYQLDAP